MCARRGAGQHRDKEGPRHEAAEALPHHTRSRLPEHKERTSHARDARCLLDKANQHGIYKALVSRMSQPSREGENLVRHSFLSNPPLLKSRPHLNTPRHTKDTSKPHITVDISGLTF